MISLDDLIRRSGKAVGSILMAVFAVSMMHSAVRGAQVAFDLPSSIECRDVTTREFAALHPDLRLIEVRLRISARMIDGGASEIVDFEYVLKTNTVMRIQSYTPTTTLESAVAEDHIEITDATEATNANGLDAHVAYKPLSLGGSHNQTSKKAESSHFKQIAAQDIVLASGTIDREHGVFFRIRPSRTSALEGGKDFTFVATVPRTWRADLCAIACGARATKHSVFSTSVVPAGNNQIEVGMYLAGDGQAANLAEELRVYQDAYAKLAADAAKENVFQTISTETGSLLAGKPSKKQALKESRKAIADTQQRIKQLAQ